MGPFVSKFNISNSIPDLIQLFPQRLTLFVCKYKKNIGYYQIFG